MCHVDEVDGKRLRRCEIDDDDDDGGGGDDDDDDDNDDDVGKTVQKM